jgi:hypothetical protein
MSVGLVTAQVGRNCDEIVRLIRAFKHQYDNTQNKNERREVTWFGRIELMASFCNRWLYCVSSCQSLDAMPDGWRSHSALCAYSYLITVPCISLYLCSDATGDHCPANWRPGNRSLKPTQQAILRYCDAMYG